MDIRHTIFWIFTTTVALVSFSVPAFAQELKSTPMPESMKGISPINLEDAGYQIVATVDGQDARIIEEGAEAFLEFKLKNARGVQPDVRYGVLVTKNTPQGDAVVHQTEYAEVVTLTEGEVISRKVPYDFPEIFISDIEYDFWLVVKNTAGLLLSKTRIGIEEENGLFTRIERGVEITECSLKEENRIVCVVGGDMLKVQNPSLKFEVYDRTLFGEKLVEHVYSGEEVISYFKGESLEVSFLLPKEAYGGVREFRTYFVDEQGVPVSSQFIFAHTTAEGSAFSIQNVTLGKTSYKKGEVANGTVFWVYSGAEQENSSKSEDLSVVVELKDGDGTLCVEPIKRELDPSKKSDVVAFGSAGFLKRCDVASVTATIVNASGVMLESRPISLGLSTKDGFMDNTVTAGFVVLAGIIGLVVYRRKKLAGQSTTTGLATFLLASAICAGANPANVEAITLSRTDMNATLTSNLDRSTYTPGQAVYVTTTTTSPPQFPCWAEGSAQYFWLAGGIDTPPIAWDSLPQNVYQIYRCPSATGQLDRTERVYFGTAPAAQGQHIFRRYAGFYGSGNLMQLLNVTPLEYFRVAPPPLPPPNQLPTATIINPAAARTIVAGTSIYFEGSGSDPDGTISGYRWRDGSCSTGAIISNSRSFSTSNLSVGTHTINFRVYDNDGAWSSACDSVVVTVTAPPSLALPNLGVTQRWRWVSQGGPATPGRSILFESDVVNGSVLETIARATAVGPFNNQFQIDLNSSNPLPGPGPTLPRPPFTPDVMISPTTPIGSLSWQTIQTITSSPWIAVAGTHRYRLCADIPPSPNGTISESNESDNCQGSFTFTVPALVPTIQNLSASNCYIAANASTCPSTVSWNITGATSPNTYNATRGASCGTGASGTLSCTLNHGNNTIQGRDGTTALSPSAVATASCTSGTSWNGTRCTVVASTQCNDSTDNDGDGRNNYPADPGCSSATDNNEGDEPLCTDNFDNDGDNLTDYPNDPGCTSATDNDETDTTPATQCSDGIDNDGDGYADYNGIDANGDGDITDAGDTPRDPGCTSATDTSEFNIGSIRPR